MITKTLLAAEVPRGGTVREYVTIDFVVPSGTHTFKVFSFYGVGTTVEAILASAIATNYITITTASQQWNDTIDSSIATNAPLGTYSCATIIEDSITGETYDAKVDANVLTITHGLGASIIDTSFINLTF